MKYHKNNINRIDLIKPIVVYDTITKEHFMLKHGIYFIEYDDKTISTIDIKNDMDLTNIDTMELKVFNKSKMKNIFNISNNNK
jgi:hypothetical protein